jgi:Holliday junction resolvasome RuvABC endonuclease subunit
MMPQMANAKVGSAALMSNLLALDQSSHTTGYAIFKDGELITASHFTFNDEDLGVRLEKLRKKIIELIDENNINEVVFEDIQLQDVQGKKDVGIKTFKILAEVFGVVHELLTELKIEFHIVAPIVWKATFKIAGKGRSQEKKMAQAYIKTTYGLDCSEDEADAACIGLHIINKQKSEFNWG